MKQSTDSLSLEIESGQQVQILSLRRRAHRALKASGLAFLATLLSIIVPVLHFLLVPLGAAATAYLAIKSFAETKAIDTHSLRCLNCNTSLVPDSQGQSLHYFRGERTNLFCFHCRTQNTLSTT